MESVISLSVRASVLVSRDGVSQATLTYSNEITTSKLRYIRRENIKSDIALIQASAVHITIEELIVYKNADLDFVFESFCSYAISQGMKSIAIFVDAECFNEVGYYFSYDKKIYIEELGTWFLIKSLYTNQ